MSVTRRFGGLFLAVIVGLTLLMIAATKETTFAEEPETPTQQEQSSHDVPADITTRGVFCDEQSYRRVIDQIQQELARNFRPDDAKGLYARRQRLKTLFSRVPRTCTRQLYEQLGTKTTSDKLSKQFHYRLATATRTELLGILKANFPSPPQQIQPSQPPGDVRVAPESYWAGAIKGNLGNQPAAFHTLNNFGDTPLQYALRIKNQGRCLLSLETQYEYKITGLERAWIAFSAQGGETREVTNGLPPHSSLHLRLFGERDYSIMDSSWCEGTVEVVLQK